MKLPLRIDGLDGFDTSSGPTYNGGSFVGGGPVRNRAVAVRLLAPMGRTATVELDLCDDRQGSTVTLDPANARRVAAALEAGAEQAEAEMARWAEVLEKQRAELAAILMRDAAARAGVDLPSDHAADTDHR